MKPKGGSRDLVKVAKGSWHLGSADEREIRALTD
jgi:hypothetical protein